ncbi:MAG: PAS domain S-box protein [Candidatus Kapaibacterium sp.]|nr:MAG: PAS domain S-box protein [Candidatus Kapabacteria bacterium]
MNHVSFSPYSLSEQDSLAQKHIEQLAHSGSAIFEALFEHSSDALFLATDEDEAWIFACNHKAREMFDAPSKDALFGHQQRTLREHPLTQEELRRHTQELHSNGVLRFDCLYTSFSQKKIWCEHTVTRIPLEQGFVRLLRLTDMTERKNLEEELRHTNNILADAEHITQLGTWEFDIEHQTIQWSAETFRLYGLEPTPGFVARELLWGLIHPDDAPALQQAVTAVIDEGKSYRLELRGLQPDGSYHFHEARGKAIRNVEGRVVKILGTVRNINADKRREAELLHNQAQLENIINNISEVIVEVSLTGIIHFVSKNWESLTGRSIEDGLERSLVDFVHPDDVPTLYGLLLRSLESVPNERFTAEYRVWNPKKHDWRWHGANAVVVRTENDAPLHILATVREIHQEKAMAEKLRRSEEFLAEAQRMARLGSWYTDLQTQTTEWSETMYYIYNVPEATRPFSSAEFLEVVHPKDKDLVAARLDAAIQHQEQGSMEFRIVHSNGMTLWLDGRVKPVLHPVTRHTIALFGIVWDITERKLAEEQIRSLNLHLEERVQERTLQLKKTNSDLVSIIEERTKTESALQRSQNNLRTLVESTNDSIWSIDREFRFTTLNAAFISVVQLYNGVALTIGSSALIETLGITEKDWYGYYCRVLQCERFIVNSQYMLSGYHFDVEISFSPIFNEQNTVLGAVVFARDITERLLAEREVREREALMNLILESIATGVALSDSNGIILRANRALAQMFGYTPEEMIGRHYTLLTKPERHEQSMQGFRQLISNRPKTPTNIETELVRRDREFVDVEILQNVIQNEASEVFVVSSVNNITERKQAETEIRRALEQERELSAMQSRFVVMVSHEFRTPLTTIRSSAQLLERNRTKWSPEKQQSYFEDIDIAVNSMTELLEDVLSWGKARANRITLQAQPTEIGEFIEGIVSGFRVIEDFKYRINTVLPEKSLLHKKALLDTKLLRQILVNLISNALKYSPEIEPILVEMVVDIASISFHIKDTGIGIAEKDQQFLFEPFYRASNVGAIAGTGLGLAIVKQAVDLHGGTIHLASESGKGTEFIVVIPCTFLENS